MPDTKQIWDECLRDIETNVSKANFSTWFRNTSIVKEEKGTVYIGAPNEFVRDWLSNKYHRLILKTLGRTFGQLKSIQYIISKQEQKGKIFSGESSPTSEKELLTKELPLQTIYVNKEDNLNPRYTFDTFVVGPFNELAYAAGQAILKNPGLTYNPFFIYGGTGLGKTHLIQAIGNTIKDKYPNKKTMYVTLEKFSIDFVNAVRKNKLNVFKEKYRRYDIIIMDDIQFISTKEGTQDELFHLFNSLYENNKQMIFSSDKHPNYIPNLEDRLKSRFSQSMIADITQPNYESRLAILEKKLKDSDVILPKEILEYIAETIEGNIRELEGSLNIVVYQTQLKNKNLTLNEVKNLIKNNIRPKKGVSIKDIVRVIANFYNLEEDSIYEKTRRKEIVKARQLIMYVLREDFNVSYPMIGQKLGGKDHTTVIHSCDKIKNSIKNDISIAQELEQVRALFK